MGIVSIGWSMHVPYSRKDSLRNNQLRVIVSHLPVVYINNLNEGKGKGKRKLVIINHKMWHTLQHQCCLRGQ